ncbi:hypothetical protein [Sporosalibacterium faouarense]|uniref:hypothetical protein n=1 Tax=Sporosalibacterium faouarense TaxID=516123 RepID=UPI001A9C6D85|nr:hypothetical protein [Sporosalibacterium faouarense]
MNWSKTIKIISNVIYTAGIITVLYLGVICLFGSNEVVDSTAMIPFTWKERAFIWIALGTVPMNIACIAVYKFNSIANSAQKKAEFYSRISSGIYFFAWQWNLLY